MTFKVISFISIFQNGILDYEADIAESMGLLNPKWVNIIATTILSKTEDQLKEFLELSKDGSRSSFLPLKELAKSGTSILEALIESGNSQSLLLSIRRVKIGLKNEIQFCCPFSIK